MPSVKPTSVTNVVSKKLKQNHKKIVIKKLIVTMPDGEIIDHQHGKYTFIEVIEKLGLEKVMRVRPQTVATEPFHLHRIKANQLIRNNLHETYNQYSSTRRKSWIS